DEPLLERKERLRELLGSLVDDAPVRFSDHFVEPGSLILKHACRMGLEGVVSKRADAPYRSGRTGVWIKSKCTQRQEFVIGGYLPSDKSGRGLRSLLVGYHENGALKYAGRVGTGFTGKTDAALKKKLDAMKARKSPFDEEVPGGKGLVWVEPELVAEVEFRAWTADRIIRHASFQGLREDKPAEEVVEERPGAIRDRKETGKASAARVPRRQTTRWDAAPGGSRWPVTRGGPRCCRRSPDWTQATGTHPVRRPNGSSA